MTSQVRKRSYENPARAEDFFVQIFGVFCESLKIVVRGCPGNRAQPTCGVTSGFARARCAPAQQGATGRNNIFSCCDERVATTASANGWDGGVKAVIRICCARRPDDAAT
jgi:hypothetical protein